jgi:GH43 family beta-xylosidase
LLAVASGAETFTNPLGPGADPWVIRWNGFYYLVSSNGRIQVAKAAKLQDIARAPKVTVWTPPATGMWSKEIWAPELHYLDGKWYVYVAADDGNNANHRMYVLEGQTQDPQGSFVFKGKIAATTDRWAIDGSVLTLGGNNYFVWSGWEAAVNGQQNLYIAAMSNPWTISGERVRISIPEYDWEKRGSGGGLPTINEAPQALIRGNDVFIIYSASGSWSDFYCLGQLRLAGTNPLVASAWTKHPQPVFSPTSQVFGPGHNGFAKSPDGVEDWIVYHAAVASGSGWNRNLRMQKLSWNSDGSPNFGIPVPEGVPLEEPSNNPNGIRRFDSPRVVRILDGNRVVGFDFAEGRNLLGRRLPLLP